MKRLRDAVGRCVWLAAALLVPLAVLAGCNGGDGGSLTDSPATAADRDLSGIAGPSDPAQVRPVERVPRAMFGTSRSAAALTFPSADGDERATFEAGLGFFITDRTAENGLGPVFNQPICLGCHRSSEQLAGFVPLNVVSPVSRGARSGLTDHSLITKASAANNINPEHPPAAAFTLFGDFFPASGEFNPLEAFGGPIQHVRATGNCEPDVIPPESIDPFLRGGIDPTTGLSALGGRRGVGERSAPPYIGRGLMEAIFAGDLVANEDPGDMQGHISSLAAVSATNPECPGDCVSGRHNENSADIAFVGGDPVVRVSRFGLRAAGPTMLQFVTGGTQGEIGVTSPLAPFEQNNNQNVGRNCDTAPDPEITENDLLNLRAMIRMISPPEFDSRLLENPALPPSDALAASIRNGAMLFGVDLVAFRNRMVAGAMPPGGDGRDDHAINQADRQLNCVGCHIPIMRTGQSPARIGARHLSHKWAPIFSDLLIHDMGQIPQGPSSPVPPKPFSLAAGTVELPRNLADFALPGQGLAFGTEWRTPPLMGIGVIGPPFLHDGRVFLSTFSRGGIRARTVTSNSGGTNLPLVVNSFDSALLAAIELHDLPAEGAGCPVGPGGSASAVCPPANSSQRSEARNVMQRFRALTPAQQQDVVNFLKSL